MFYDQTNDCIECNLDSEKQNTLRNVLANYDKDPSSCEMILEIKNPNVPEFKPYPSGGINIKILVVDVVTQEVEGPIFVRGNAWQTIGDFKRQLVNDLHIQIAEPKNLYMVCDRYYNGANLVDNMNMLKTECSFGQNRFFISTSLDVNDPVGLADENHQGIKTTFAFTNSKLKKIVDLFENIITLNFTLPPLDKESIEAMSIPYFDPNQIQAQAPSVTGNTEKQQTGSSSVPNNKIENVPIAYKKFYESNEMIVNQSPIPLLSEWENSEDGSLSDSDR